MIRTLVATCMGVALSCSAVQAAVSAEEAAKLGKSLTPLGAPKAANKDGSIPEWTGGLKNPPKGFVWGKDRAKDPFEADKPLFEITASNYKKYKDKLSAGKIALFKQYPDTYKMKVYPSRRSAAYPKRIYDETIKNATRVKITNGGAGFEGTVAGYPFPIAGNGIEVMWNHMMRYNTTGFKGYTNSALTTAAGDYLVTRNYFELLIRYNDPEITLKNFKNMNVYGMFKTTSPPSQAGDAALIHVPLDRVKDETNVWIYLGGQRRVKRIGKVGYDNPLDNTEGLVTHDQIDMFNGPFDRYDFVLKGMKEMYLPYNAYEMYSDKISYKKMLTKGHPNQEYPRYELARTIVVEATVKKGKSHIYEKRVFYLDADSWMIVLQDMYDKRGQFWRTAEAFPINFYAVPTMLSGLQVHYDLQSRRYYMSNLTNEEKTYIEFNFKQPVKAYKPSQFKRWAVKKH